MACTIEWCGHATLHIPPVLPAHFKQRIRNLSQRAVFHRFHQLGKQVAVGYGDLLELLDARRGLVGVALVQQALPTHGSGVQIGGFQPLLDISLQLLKTHVLRFLRSFAADAAHHLYGIEGLGGFSRFHT